VGVLGLAADQAEVPTPADHPAPRNRRLKIALVSVVVALSVFLVASLVLVSLLSSLGTSPNSFWFAKGPDRVGPGTIGCRMNPDEVCYSFAFGMVYKGVTLSRSSFQVVNRSYALSGRGSEGPIIPLGPIASVSVLSSTSTIAGSWNYSSSVWSNGSGWVVPTNVNVTVILDTGLLTNATLANTGFEIVLSSPNGGAVGCSLN
jgi:hypothetical protein